MNILIGSSSALNRGSGIRTYVEIISREMTRQGHNVYYACPYADGMLEQMNSDNAYYLNVSQDLNPSRSLNEILNYIQDKSIDFVVNNDNPFIAMAAPRLQCPIISIGHLATTSIAALVCYEHQWIDYVVAISEDMKATFADKFGVPQSKIRIVYNGVEAQAAPPQRNDSQCLNLVFAGGLNKRKGGDKVLTSVLKGQEHWQGMHLHWFGEIDEVTKIQLDDLDFVTCYGKVSRSTFIERIADSDVLLLPSVSEGCPMVMLEAMSYGVVPLASDGKGAMSRLVIHGEEGFICSLRLWQSQMFSCLNFVRDNPAALKSMSDAVYRRQKMEFTIQHVVERLLKLGRSPVVNRTSMPSSIKLLKWHRPIAKNGKAPLLDRLAIKTGRLRRAGKIDYS